MIGSVPHGSALCIACSALQQVWTGEGLSLAGAYKT